MFYFYAILGLFNAFMFLVDSSPVSAIAALYCVVCLVLTGMPEPVKAKVKKDEVKRD